MNGVDKEAVDKEAVDKEPVDKEPVGNSVAVDKDPAGKNEPAGKDDFTETQRQAVESLLADVNSENLWQATTDALWQAILAFESYSFSTTSGLPFTYEFKLNRRGEKGNEIVVSRKEKTITRSSVEKALAVVMDKNEPLPVKMSTPKELNVFGASYIYPLFIRFGLVEHIGSHQRGGPRKGSKRRSMGSNSDVGNTQQE